MFAHRDHGASPRNRCGWLLGLAVAAAACGRLHYEPQSRDPLSINGVGGPGNTTARFNSLPFTVFQDDLTSGEPNRGGPAAANTAAHPYQFGIYFDPAQGAERLFVNDRLNRRVLIFDGVPTDMGAQASVVLGQPDFTSTAANAGRPTPHAGGFGTPVGVNVCVGGEVLVSDNQHNRILVWNRVPTESGRDADYVLGQASMTAVGSGTSASRFSLPYAAHCIGERLVVVDKLNHRLVVYEEMPRKSGAAADFAVGQRDLGSAERGCAADRFNQPYEVVFDGEHYYVADGMNHRVLVFEELAPGVAATVVLGQPDFTHSDSNQGLGQPNASTMVTPNGVHVRDGLLAVSDHGNNRVLLFELPVETGAAATWVIGQPSPMAAEQVSPPTAESLGPPKSALIADGAIWLGDERNHRLLVRALPD